MSYYNKKTFQNRFAERPMVEQIQDPLGRELYSIYGDMYEAKYDREGLRPSSRIIHKGAILVVESVETVLDPTGYPDQTIRAVYLDQYMREQARNIDSKERLNGVLATSYILNDPVPSTNAPTGRLVSVLDSRSSDFKVLYPLVNDPCPFCGGELTANHMYEDRNLGTVKVQHQKFCESCKVTETSPLNDTDNTSWWDEDGNMLDPATRSIVYNPNYIDFD